MMVTRIYPAEGAKSDLYRTASIARDVRSLLRPRYGITLSDAPNATCEKQKSSKKVEL